MGIEPPPSRLPLVSNGYITREWQRYLEITLGKDQSLGELADLTGDEIIQLTNINNTIISAAQWAIIGRMDQGVSQSDDVTFHTVNGVNILSLLDVAIYGAWNAANWIFDHTEYMGYNTDIVASNGDSGWNIWKFNHPDDPLTTIQGPLIGVWDDRASLSWL